MCGIPILALVLILCQENKCKDTAEALNVLHHELADIKNDLQKRDTSDIWNSIKNTANRAWQYIKTLANNKERIKDWIEKCRIKAHDLGKMFEERLIKMKHRFNEMIKKIMKTGETVKKCLQERKKEIDEILKKILFDVTDCISNSLTYINNLALYQHGPIPNETDFFKLIQSDVSLCLKTYKQNDEIEECIQIIRRGIYKTMEIAEENIIQDHNETRAATDDLLNTIVECTTDGIIKSTTAIANETVHIIECVSKG